MMRGLLLVALLVAAASAQQLMVKKSLVSSHNGLYTISVSYKKGVAAVTDVRIKDSLPEHLELVSGDLNTAGPNVWNVFFSFFSTRSAPSVQPAKEYYHNEYTVRVIDLEFSLDKRVHDLMLPAASVTFTKEDGSEGTVRTNTLPLPVKGPVIPEGHINQPLLVVLLTLGLPAGAAVVLLHLRRGHFGAVSKTKKQK